MQAPLYQRLALALLRIFAAGIMMQHGVQKLFGLLGGVNGQGGTVPLVSQFGLAGILETFVALLVLVGLFTRPAAFILAGEMAVAFFQAHFPRAFWPIENGGELPVLLCFVFLFFAAFGAGSFSLDALLARNKESVQAERSVRVA
ncbi:MAG TPA: DoxX family protein [Gemmatimonadaceae bacterium]|jgi:putative oxidoreductase|nr:DoxX family protein [Gemmatimonadaceae bacterium]